MGVWWSDYVAVSADNAFASRQFECMLFTNYGITFVLTSAWICRLYTHSPYFVTADLQNSPNKCVNIKKAILPQSEHTGEPPLWVYRMPDLKAGRRKVKCSDIIWARSTQSSHRHQLLFPVLLALSSVMPLFWNNQNHLHLVMVLMGQTDMVVCHSWA